MKLVATIAAALLASTAAHAYTMSITPEDASNFAFQAEFLDSYVGSSNFSIPGYGAFDGPAHVYPADYDEPGVVADTGPGNAYIGVLASQDEFLTLDHSRTSFTFLWGSADTYNNLEFVNTTTHTMSADIPGAALNGLNGAMDYWVTFSGLPSFDQVQFHNMNQNAFEFALPNSGGLATPEPSTWAMLMLGFAGLGYAGYRRKAHTPRLATIA